MPNVQKRWYAVAVGMINARISTVPQTDAELKEDFQKNPNLFLKKFSEIGVLLKLLVDASHDVPAGEKAWFNAQIARINRDLTAINRKITTIKNDTN